MLAAIAAIEARVGVVFLNRQFSWQLTVWRDQKEQALPKRPVQSLDGISLIDAADQTEIAPIEDFQLLADSQVPLIVARSCFPNIPLGGSVEILFTAGFGELWSDIPSDLAQAMILLAAYYYENRNGNSLSETQFPPMVLSLIEPYRQIRGMRG